MQYFTPSRSLIWQHVRGYDHSLRCPFPRYSLRILDLTVEIVPAVYEIEGGVTRYGNPSGPRLYHQDSRVQYELQVCREGEEDCIFYDTRSTFTEIIECFESEVLPYLRDYGACLTELAK